MEERTIQKNHKLVINNRKTSLVTGVADVLSFDLNEILLETEQVQAYIRIKGAVDLAVDDLHDHFACGADHRAVQMPADDAALCVARAHVQMGVIRAVHGAHRAGQRHDLHIAREVVGLVLLFFIRK